MTDKTATPDPRLKDAEPQPSESKPSDSDFPMLLICQRIEGLKGIPGVDVRTQL